MREGALEGLTLEGLQDNRLHAVRADEASRVSTTRHSDRDLLDADEAKELEGLTFKSAQAAEYPLECIEFDLRADVAHDPLFKGRSFLLRNLLTPPECATLIEATEQFGLSELQLCGGTKRRCHRLAFRSETLHDMLWTRVKRYLQPIRITPENGRMFLNLGMEGLWMPASLSGVFRVVKYFPGGHISPHFDGEWVDNDDRRSIKTILLYLNEGYAGGLTRFLDHRDDDIGLRYETTDFGATVAANADVVGVVPVTAGIGAVFDAKMLHEGTSLDDGVKWLLRADIVYERTERLYEPDSNRMKAIHLLNEAEYLEEAGRPDLAVRNYRAAYKMCPEIEFEAR